MKTQLQNSDFDSGSSYKLHRLVQQLDHYADEMLKDEYELTLSQFMVLMTIGCLPEPSQREVAIRLKLTPAAVSRQVDSLQDLRLVSRRQKPENRREHQLHLTAKGQVKTLAARKLLSSRFNSFAERHLGRTEQQVFLKSLDKLLLAIEKSLAKEKAKG